MPAAEQAVIATLQQLPFESLLEVTVAAEDGVEQSLLLYRDAAGVRAWRNLCPHAMLQAK